MSARGVLFSGLIVSIIYIFSIVYFQSDKNFKEKKSGTLKFLYIKDKNHIEIVSKLSAQDKNGVLIKDLDMICRASDCNKNISFLAKTSDKDFSDLVKELVLFSYDYNITKASVIVDDKVAEIDFLLNDQTQLKKLKEIYKKYTKHFDIKDNSSVLEYFSIEKIEKSINSILEKEPIEIDSEVINFKTRRVLNQVFRKLKALGSLNIVFSIDIDEKAQKILKDFIKKNYPWIIEIEFKKSKIRSIKIKEVLT